MSQEAYENQYRRDLEESMGVAMIRYNVASPQQLEIVMPDMKVTISKKNLVIDVAQMGNITFGTTLTVKAGSQITIQAPKIELVGDVHVAGVLTHDAHGPHG